jgi:hypothetical protein
VELLQSPIIRRGGDVEDEDIGKEMNKQVPFEDLSLVKTRLNYD